MPSCFPVRHVVSEHAHTRAPQQAHLNGKAAVINVNSTHAFHALTGQNICREWSSPISNYDFALTVVAAEIGKCGRQKCDRARLTSCYVIRHVANKPSN